jgi:hypothetical protein
MSGVGDEGQPAGSEQTGGWDLHDETFGMVLWSAGGGGKICAAFPVFQS